MMTLNQAHVTQSSIKSSTPLVISNELSIVFACGTNLTLDLILVIAGHSLKLSVQRKFFKKQTRVQPSTMVEKTSLTLKNDGGKNEMASYREKARVAILINEKFIIKYSYFISS